MRTKLNDQNSLHNEYQGTEQPIQQAEIAERINVLNALFTPPKSKKNDKG